MIGFHPISETERVTLRQKFGISDAPEIDQVRRALSVLKRCVFIFDEFDRGSATAKRMFTDLIKALSDYAIDATLVLVGVSETIDELIRDHASDFCEEVRGPLLERSGGPRAYKCRFRDPLMPPYIFMAAHAKGVRVLPLLGTTAQS